MMEQARRNAAGRLLRRVLPPIIWLIKTTVQAIRGLAGLSLVGIAGLSMLTLLTLLAATPSQAQDTFTQLRQTNSTAWIITVITAAVTYFFSEPMVDTLRRWERTLRDQKPSDPLSTLTDAVQFSEPALGVRTSSNEATLFPPIIIIPPSRFAKEALRELPPGALQALNRISGDPTSNEKAIALYVQQRIRHSVTAGRANLTYWTLQIGAVTLAAATPILVLLTTYSNGIKVVPAVVSAALAGLNGIRDWRGNATTHTRAANQMDSEYVAFDHGSGTYVGHDNAQQFASRIAEIDDIAGAGEPPRRRLQKRRVTKQN